MDCTVHGVAKSWTQLSDFHFHFQEARWIIFQRCVVYEKDFLKSPVFKEACYFRYSHPWIYYLLFI